MEMGDRTNRGSMNRAATATPDVAAAVAEIEIKALLEQAAVGVTKTEIATGKYVFVNQRFADIVGYTREELLKMSFHDITHPADLATDLSNEQLLIAGTLHEYAMEKRYIRKDGTAIWVRRTVSPLELPGETPRYLIGIIEDITERKKAEEALRESEEKFRDVFELSPLGKSITGIDGTLHVNRAFADMLGYSQEELETANWRDLTHPDDLQKSAELVASLLSGKADQMSMEKRYIHKSGQIVWTEVITFLARDSSGKPKFFLTSVQDITQRRQAEEKLRKSEERYSLINNASRDSIYSYDTLGRFTSANRSLCELLKLEESEIVGHTHAELGFPDATCKEWDSLHRRVYETDNTVSSETTAPMPDGTVHDFEVVLNPLHDSNGIVVGIGGTTRDITERKKAEEERGRFMAMLEQSLNEIYVFDATTLRFTYVNEGARRNLGYSMDELMNMTPVDLKPLFTNDSFRASVQPLIAGEKPRLVFETIHRRKDGKIGRAHV